MFEGKVTSAVRLLCESENTGLVEMSEATMKTLKEKHPPPAAILPETLLHGPINEVDASFFSNIDEQNIFRATKLTSGAAGPSQADAAFFKYILTSKNFKNEAKNLREQIARLAKKLATQYVDPKSIEAYVNCRLIPVNKCPGVRPIDIGETIRRIVGKSLSWVLKDVIQETTGPLQVCTGLKSGGEAAIHFIREQFEADSAEAVILVDASNAFNSLNRQVMMHNIQILIPEFATIAINMYRVPSKLFVTGEVIMSSEGTTQGDNLAMSLFAIGTLPILRLLTDRVREIQQVWLADDSTGVGRLVDLRRWWELLISEGVKYGYYVNQLKSCLLLKTPELHNQAKEIFKDMPIKIITDGHRHLGGVIGTSDFKHDYNTKLVDEWCSMLEQLAKFAETQPHAAYSAFTHGVRHKMTFFFRSIPTLDTHIERADKIITSKFLPALFGCQISPQEREILSLPLRFGGLGIPILKDLAPKDYQTSVRVTKTLVENMRQQTHDNGNEQIKQHQMLMEILKDREKEEEEKKRVLFDNLDPALKRLLDQASAKGSSSWLSCIPLSHQGFVLNKSEFRDALCLRYGKSIKNLPSNCGCGAKYDVNHALNCHRGGFVIIRHNELRDFNAHLLKKVCNDVETEPCLQPVTEGETTALSGDHARPDIRARGFWTRGQHAFFDVRVVNLNADSYRKVNSKKVFARAEYEKKSVYDDCIINLEHGTFTPLVYSITGGMGQDAETFYKLLSSKLAKKKWHEYKDVTRFIRCKLSFLIIKLSLLCIRGSRVLPSTDYLRNVDDDFEYDCFVSKL